MKKIFCRRILIVCFAIVFCFNIFLAGCDKNDVPSSNTHTDISQDDGSSSSTHTDISQDDSLFPDIPIDISQYEGLPLISINTQDNKNIESNKDYVNSSFSISNSAIFDGTDFTITMKASVKDDNSVGIRLRGNSTLMFPKKAYRIKFDKKQSLFDLEKNKSWVLLADYIDQSSIRNYASYTFADSLDNISFAVTPHHVVLSINGNYRGLYLLCEQVDENKGRANVKEDITSDDVNFPFLIEMVDQFDIEGTLGIDYFIIENNYYPIQVKYPEYEDRIIGTNNEDTVFNYIKEYMSAVFITLKTGGSVQFNNQTVFFEDLVDVDSFIDYFFVNEVFHNTDSNWKNIFMHKTKDGKLKMGPNWDFDLCCTDLWTGIPYDQTNTKLETANSFSCFNRDNCMMNAFLKKQSNYDLVCTRWSEIKENVINLTNELQDYKKIIEKAAEFDSLYWYGKEGDKQFDEQYQFVISFLNMKYNFLNNNLILGDNIFD